ncbi:MAG: uroporphyrinogen decarboxylase [Planctomycetes bacterium]|nr:uroporphyrinogen decarboxylase [Planctomycetota bacterium]
MDSRELLIKSALGGETPRPPIWLMRQAGRYMAEYRNLRKSNSFMELCHKSELAAEITLQPIRAFNMDGAILFCDILVTAEALGADVEIVEKQGPVIANPIDKEGDLHSMPPTEEAVGSLGYVAKTIGMIRNELGQKKALLGFAGAPFTVASYMIEGGSSKMVPQTFKMINESPELFAGLMSRLTDLTIKYVEMQREAGVDAVQIFESWASLLPEEMYLKHVFPHLKRLVESLHHPEKPLILFALATNSLWQHLGQLPAQVLSIDSSHSLGNFRKLYPEKALQGNLDSRWLLGSRANLLTEVDRILAEMSDRKGYIFNLGHGITPKTPVDNVKALCDHILGQ